MPEAPEPDDPHAPLQVQVRDLPSMRAAYTKYRGPAATIGEPFSRLQRLVTDAKIGPAGPLLCSFRALADNTGVRISEADENIEATLLVPVTRLHDHLGPDVVTRRFASQRAACLMYSGPMDAGFRRRHLELFAWLDLHELPHAGTVHQHAYLGRDSQQEQWTIEIRVPILAAR